MRICFSTGSIEVLKQGNSPKISLKNQKVFGSRRVRVSRLMLGFFHGFELRSTRAFEEIAPHQSSN